VAAGERLGEEERRLEALQLAVRTREGVPAGALPVEELGDLVAVEAAAPSMTPAGRLAGAGAGGAAGGAGRTGGEGDRRRAVLTVRGRLLANEVALRLR
jgi:hypothetical protein